MLSSEGKHNSQGILELNGYAEGRKLGDESNSETVHGCCVIQGWREDSDPDIAVLFDKLPNPGDHCIGPKRIWAPLCREVVLVDGSMQAILEKNWPAFASNQVELLVKAGFSRATAEDGIGPMNRAVGARLSFLAPVPGASPGRRPRLV